MKSAQNNNVLQTSVTARHSRNQKQILLPQGGIRMTCHPDPALREKDLLFFAPRDEVVALCYSGPRRGGGGVTFTL